MIRQLHKNSREQCQYSEVQCKGLTVDFGQGKKVDFDFGKINRSTLIEKL